MRRARATDTNILPLSGHMAVLIQRDMVCGIDSALTLAPESHKPQSLRPPGVGLRRCANGQNGQ